MCQRAVERCTAREQQGAEVKAACSDRNADLRGALGATQARLPWVFAGCLPCFHRYVRLGSRLIFRPSRGQSGAGLRPKPCGRGSQRNSSAER
jgi:hypothetical protein